MSKKSTAALAKTPAPTNNETPDAPALTEAQETEARALTAWQETEQAITDQEALIANAQADLAALLEQARAEDEEAEGWRVGHEALRRQITSARVLLETNARQASREGITEEGIVALEGQKQALATRLGAWDEAVIDRETERARNVQAIREQIKADQGALADLRLKLETLADAYRAAKRTVGQEALTALEAEFAALEQEEAEAEAHLATLRHQRNVLQRSVSERLARYKELQGAVTRLGPPLQATLAERLLTAWLDWWNLLAQVQDNGALATALQLSPREAPRLFDVLHINEHQLRLLLWVTASLPGGSGQAARERPGMIAERRAWAEQALNYWQARRERAW